MEVRRKIRSMKKNFVDSTTIHAVESLFRNSERDPWAATLAGELADLIVYSDIIRYPVPSRHRGGGYDLAHEDSLLRDLVHRDSDVFSGKEYSTARPRVLASKHLFTSFEQFGSWARANQISLRRWIALHHSPWIQQRRAATTGETYTFDLDRLLKRPELNDLVEVTHLAPLDLCYAFDSVLKYPIFGELAGSKGYYLNHPLRDAFKLPTMRKDNATPPPVAVSFRDSVAQLVRRQSRDEYTSLLHELRGAVREAGLHEMSPGEFDPEQIREIAARVRLSPRLRGYSRGVAVTTGIIGGLGAVPVFWPAAIIGGLISIGAAYWTGGLPRQVARVSWLRWAMKWDVEEQAERRS